MERKFFKILNLCVLITFSSLSLNANAFGMNSEISYLINQTYDSNVWEKTTDTWGREVYYLRNTDYVLDYFNNNRYMSRSSAQQNGRYVSVFPKGQNVFKKECVSFVNATGWESFGHTSNWNPVYKLDKNVVKNFGRGTQIATFNSNGKYSGHVAYFLEPTKNGIKVIDQNYYKNGRVSIHEIRFNGSGGVGDAGSYWYFHKY